MIGNILYANLCDLEERLRGMPEEKDIPTALFNEILYLYLAEGWRCIYEYDAPDAWIDYGRVHLKNGASVLRFRWDNYDEGSIAGPQKDIADIARYLRDRLA